ncbi:chromatin assembly factor 1 subunit A domain-containing protein [Hirsutella rhossiliensis]|uniref:Chromatin assembly factor 1 subunit A domain-containing protein n=1 Tax=Hirsutella rhossiliensis TaxID=111463 RepID=A0A9P8N3L7_9HYPO|nr:chromatin assembly factor 1 subunit A domain-containing protein [Hirsutella rhossiliensis]KAH0965234.1 chromatin assembly factor 1 subunit A domain-containing protein [Hirsutella rhossiliensis]
MPLFQMEPNTQEMEPAGRKRSHNEFSDDLVKADIDTNKRPAAPVLPPVSQDRAESPPNGSPALTDAGRSTSTPQSRSPQTPSKATASASKPVVKRKRLTPQEKEARDKDIAEKKREREAQAALRAAEKAKQEEEKAARAKERDEKRKKKEEEDRVKAEKKRKREEEQQRVQAEKDKKARTQTNLKNFFNTPRTPNRTTADSDSNSGSPSKTDSAAPESKPRPSVYQQLFKPFFVKTDTRWIESTVKMNQETREAKSQVLDDFISGRRELEDTSMSFDAKELLCLPCKMPKKGRLHHPVRHIMETACREAGKLESAGGVAPNDVLEGTHRKLAKVPMKVITFSQDVRPPYYGTLTLKPFALGLGNMSRQARRSSHRRLPLDYDYDSEAEWQDEEGEDVDIDDDDDEQEDEDDMEGFLDDSEDAGLARRVFANTMEPSSSGIRFENQPGGSDRLLDEYKMEFMHGPSCGIDPWSAQYWEPEPKKKTVKSEEGSKMAPPPTPANVFGAIRNAAETEAPKLVKTELWGDMKRVILNNKALSKGSIIDIIFHQFRDGVSRAEVKNTIELIAEKKGSGRSKEWDIKPKYKIEP